jgi:hypothetical protein
MQVHDADAPLMKTENYSRFFVISFVAIPEVGLVKQV